MSPGWLLLPFSELVLSSLSQPFSAAEGTAREFARWSLGMPAPRPGPPASGCPSALLPCLCAALPTRAMLSAPWKVGSRISSRRGRGPFSPLLLGSLQYSYQAPKPMRNTQAGTPTTCRDDWLLGCAPRPCALVEAGTRHSPWLGVISRAREGSAGSPQA